MSYTLIFSQEARNRGSEGDYECKSDITENSKIVYEKFNQNVALTNDGKPVAYTAMYNTATDWKKEYLEDDAHEVATVDELRIIVGSNGEPCNTDRYEKWGYDPTQEII